MEGMDVIGGGVNNVEGRLEGSTVRFEVDVEGVRVI